MPILQVVSCYRNPRLGAAVTVRLSRCNPPTCSGGRYSICFPTEERCRILHKETCFPFFPFCTRGRLSTVTPLTFFVLVLCFASLQGGNRNRVQQPHHRVLMRDKQLSKRKQVAEKKEQRHTISSGGEKQVAVSGSLGPFSLLLQVCRHCTRNKQIRFTF